MKTLWKMTKLDDKCVFLINSLHEQSVHNKYFWDSNDTLINFIEKGFEVHIQFPCQVILNKVHMGRIRKSPLGFFITNFAFRLEAEGIYYLCWGFVVVVDYIHQTLIFMSLRIVMVAILKQTLERLRWTYGTTNFKKIYERAKQLVSFQGLTKHQTEQVDHKHS